MALSLKHKLGHAVLITLSLISITVAQGNLFGAVFNSGSSGVDRRPSGGGVGPETGIRTGSGTDSSLGLGGSVNPGTNTGTGTGTDVSSGTWPGSGSISGSVPTIGGGTEVGPGTGTGVNTGSGSSITFTPPRVGVPTIVPPLWTTPSPKLTPEAGATTPEPCRYRPGSDSHFYEEYIFGLGWRERLCPLGTLFNTAKCACHDLEPVTEQQCRPEFYLDFDSNDIRDRAGSNIPIGNNGDKKITSVSRAGRFDGSGILTVWRYSNTDFGRELTINFRFYDFPGGDEEQVLISNCYNQQPGSVEVAIDRRTKHVIFRGDSVSSTPQEIRIPFRDQAWKNVTLIYDGSSLRGQVDNDEKSAPMQGNLDIRYSGLLIGQCEGRKFYGYIDELRLYRCVKDQSGLAEAPAFRAK
ncbi:hypothetical protein ScPMuIL_005664 [Solemya velum]